jgi:hypothetical protein
MDFAQTQFEKWIVPLAITVFAALAPIHSILLVVGVLIVGDMILGIWAAIKSGESIVSSRMRDTVSKMFIYQTVIIMGFIVEKWMLQEFIPISKLTASVIGVVEMKSIYENAGIILGQPLFKELVIKLGSKNRE